ncbi:hypothetical protein NIES208_06005 [[Limnothrix rosea] IAM M-220]|nr:hypothetical protein NIES208_06005 [[Limnothrix rosea] IAM M-220]
MQREQENFRQITDSIKEVFFLIDSDTDKIFYVSPAYEKVWGRSCESLYLEPQSWLLAIHPDDCSRAMGTLETQFRTGEEFQEEYRIIRPDQSICWVRVQAFPVRDNNDKVYRFVGIAEDITQRKKTEKSLHKSEEHFKLIFEQAPIGIAVTNLKGEFEQVNPAFCEILEYKSSEILSSRIFDVFHANDTSESELLFVEKLFENNESEFQIELQCETKNNRQIDVILKAVIVFDEFDDPVNCQYQLLDITDRKSMERQLIHDALHDPLTQLPNRTLFTDRLKAAIACSKKSRDYQYAVLFLDVDRFKIINDSLGHLLGDKLLIEIAQRLQEEIGGKNTIARFGGDEFTVLLDNISDFSVAIQVANKIQHRLRDYFDIDGNRIFVSASIGITLCDYQNDKPEDILRDADATMYKAKEKGRACYEVFDKSLRLAASNRLKLETELRSGIFEKQFCLFYQPIVNLSASKIEGFEALLRWNHPTKGLIGPHLLIPVAEETGLILSLGEMIFELAFKQLAKWQWQGKDLTGFKLSINLSGKQLMAPDLIPIINRLLSRINVDPRMIKLEITESVLLEEDYDAISVLKHLRNCGFGISLDDFGTGYSSLSYLQRLPIDTLKIDRSFIQKIQRDEDNKNLAIVQSIITLSHAIGLSVIAEGVETKEQLVKLQSLGCESIQGYLFSPPVDEVAASDFLGKRIIDL